MEINTNRLRILWLTREQLERYLYNTVEFYGELGLNGDALQASEIESMSTSLDKCSCSDMGWYSVMLIILRQTGYVCGEACLCGLSPNRKALEIGYTINAQNQNNGIMTEALTAISDELLRRESKLRILAYCAPDNAASARVLEKSGFYKYKNQQDGLICYYKKHTKPAYPLFVCFFTGALLGALIGHFVFGHFNEGMNIGVFTGLTCGVIITAVSSRRRRQTKNS